VTCFYVGKTWVTFFRGGLGFGCCVFWSYLKMLHRCTKCCTAKMPQLAEWGKIYGGVQQCSILIFLMCGKIFGCCVGWVTCFRFGFGDAHRQSLASSSPLLNTLTAALPRRLTNVCSTGSNLLGNALRRNTPANIQNYNPSGIGINSPHSSHLTDIPLTSSSTVSSFNPFLHMSHMYFGT